MLLVTFFVCLVTKLFTKARVDLCLDLWLSVPAARRQHNYLYRNGIKVVDQAKLAASGTIEINKLLISKQQIDY